MDINKNICTDLLEVMVSRITVKSGPADPLGPQTRCFPGSLCLESCFSDIFPSKSDRILDNSLPYLGVRFFEFQYVRFRMCPFSDFSLSKIRVVGNPRSENDFDSEIWKLSRSYSFLEVMTIEKASSWLDSINVFQICLLELRLAC